jgi:membrane protease YdiL (CAAX protease family)
MDISTQNNRLFELARLGTRRFSPRFDKIYPALALFYALTAPLATSVVVSIPLAVYFILTGNGQIDAMTILSSSLGFTILLLLGFGPIFILVWAWLWLFERRHLWTIGMERKGWLLKYLRGALLGIFMIAAAVGLSVAFGYVTLEGSGIEIGVAISGSMLLLVGWIVQGAAEEALFRGFLLPILGTRYGPVVGVLASSVLFALLHLFNTNLSLLAVLNLTLFGMFTAFYAFKEGGLWGVFAIHSLWNWAQGNLFGMQVSGIPVQLDAIFKLKETGPDWFTGGAFGPEGGIAVTLVLLAGIIALSLRWRGHRLEVSRAGGE